MTVRIGVLLAALLLPTAAAVFGDSWQVPSLPAKGTNHSQNVEIRRSDDSSVPDYLLPGHSCYEAAYNGSVLSFCYPRLVVTGLPKAGTSALHELMEEHPNFVAGAVKENCVGDLSSADSLWVYFKGLSSQLAAAKEVGSRPAVLVSGCIHRDINIAIHTLLHQPTTTYVIMTRDFSDMLWATYNFWCSPSYDGPEHCTDARWANRDHHYRSPEMFHEMVIAQAQGKLQYGYPHPLRYRVVYPPSRGIYQNYAAAFESGGVRRDRVLLLACPQLSSNVTTIWSRLVASLNATDKGIVAHPGLDHFGRVRVNTG